MKTSESDTGGSWSR